MSDHPELETADGKVTLAVHVQPGAGRTEVMGRHGEALKLRVAAPPTGDRANDAVVDLVAKEFNLKRADVVVLSGATSRDKRLKLGGLDQRAAEKIVDRLLESPRLPEPPLARALLLRQLRLVLGGRRLDGLEVALDQLGSGGAGAGLGVDRGVVLALEPRGDVAGEELEAAPLRGGVGPVVGELQVGPESAVGLLPEAVDLLDGVVWGADGADTALVDEVDELLDVRARRPRPSAGTPRCVGSSRTTTRCREPRLRTPARGSRRCASARPGATGRGRRWRRSGRRALPSRPSAGPGRRTLPPWSPRPTADRARSGRPASGRPATRRRRWRSPGGGRCRAGGGDGHR